MTIAVSATQDAGSAASSALHTAVARRLEEARQRYSPGRRALVDVLAESERPVTSVEIAMRDPGLSLSSVYRNLSILEQAGVVRRLVTQEDNARYELSEELTSHHDHLICEQCGEVSDYTLGAQLEQAITAALETLAKRSSFHPRRHHLEIAGLCNRCAEPRGQSG